MKKYKNIIKKFAEEWVYCTENYSPQSQVKIEHKTLDDLTLNMAKTIKSLDNRPSDDEELAKTIYRNKDVAELVLFTMVYAQIAGIDLETELDEIITSLAKGRFEVLWSPSDGAIH